MPRELWFGYTNVANLGTSMTDITPVMGSAEGVELRVRVVNRHSSNTSTFTAALRNSSGTIQQYVVPTVTIGVGEALEFDVAVGPSRKLSVQAGTANVLDVVVVDAVRQY